jgi:hypothetical protein
MPGKRPIQIPRRLRTSRRDRAVLTSKALCCQRTRLVA